MDQNIDQLGKGSLALCFITARLCRQPGPVRPFKPVHLFNIHEANPGQDVRGCFHANGTLQKVPEGHILKPVGPGRHDHADLERIRIRIAARIVSIGLYTAEETDLLLVPSRPDQA